MMTDEELLAECKVQVFLSSGPGGQHAAKTSSAVRLIHLPTGIRVQSGRERSQYLNKMECIARLKEKLRKLNEKPKKRVPTRVPRSAKRATRQEKERQSTKKQMRRKPSSEE